MDQPERLLIADLDCEVTWAGAPPLPAPVRTLIAALGTLMRPLASSDRDAIELPAAVDPARMPAVAGVPRPRLVVRGEHGLQPGSSVAWSGGGAVGIARLANDRRLAHRVEDALGAAPTGAAIATSLAELEAHLPAAVAGSPTGAWVAKATLCAAGRDRVRRRGAALDDATRARLTRLLARGGALLLEPWLDRVLDLGQSATIVGGRIELAAPHRLLCDDTGGFRGIAVAPDPAIDAHRAALAAAALAAGAALVGVGHQGRFGIDAFVHRRDGAEVLRPLVEINARLTFGWLALHWSRALGCAGTLEVGRGVPPAGALPLLLPGDRDPTAAWFAPQV